MSAVVKTIKCHTHTWAADDRDNRQRKGSVVGGTMASAEHEPITGVWNRAPSGVQGQSLWSGGQGAKPPLKLKAFWSLDVQRSRQI